MTSFISPYRKDRDAVRTLHVAGKLPFIEIHVATPIETCERRNPKGLYKKARTANSRASPASTILMKAQDEPRIDHQRHRRQPSGRGRDRTGLSLRKGLVEEVGVKFTPPPSPLPGAGGGERQETKPSGSPLRSGEGLGEGLPGGTCREFRVTHTTTYLSLHRSGVAMSQRRAVDAAHCTGKPATAVGCSSIRRRPSSSSTSSTSATTPRFSPFRSRTAGSP